MVQESGRGRPGGRAHRRTRNRQGHPRSQCAGVGHPGRNHRQGWRDGRRRGASWQDRGSWRRRCRPCQGRTQAGGTSAQRRRKGRRLPRPSQPAAPAPVPPSMPASPAAAKIAADHGVDTARRGGVRQARPGPERRCPRLSRKGPGARAFPRARACSSSRPGFAAARARARQRRGARGARSHDAAAPDHRPAPQGRPEYRRHADDLQRGRHDRDHGIARPLQGRASKRSTARNSASWDFS